MGNAVIIMGSRSDREQGQAVAEALGRLGVPHVMRIASAHKSPQHLLAMLAAYEAGPGPHVYITIAGRSNALSGMVDAAVSGPVIACPPYSERFAGADLLSSLRMPSGVAPGAVLEPAGAALLAAKILALADPALQERIRRRQATAQQQILDDDAALEAEP